MGAERLNDHTVFGFTLCFHCKHRHIRNNIVLVKSLIDANTDGVIMMFDLAMASDSVDHEHVEIMLFCMGCDGIGKADEHQRASHCGRLGTH